MQHIEAAGIHPDDSACVFPAYKSVPGIPGEMADWTARIARDIGVRGFINIQFVVKDSTLYILEVNPRASRTVPFLSKVTGVDLVEAAVKLWRGQSLIDQGLVASGAVGIGIGSSVVGCTLPTAGRVFVSVNEFDRETILSTVRRLRDLGFQIAATRGTANFLFGRGVFPEVILKIHEGHPNVVDHMNADRIQLVINTPKGRFTQLDGDYIRFETVRRKIPHTTTTSAAAAAVEGIRYLMKGEVTPRRLRSDR